MGKCGLRRIPAALPLGKTRNTKQDAWWAVGSVWTGAENIAPHRDSVPVPSSCSESLLHFA
jgi:hypothetical protein